MAFEARTFALPEEKLGGWIYAPVTGVDPSHQSAAAIDRQNNPGNESVAHQEDHR
jgi:hypothetical protein